MRIRAMQAGEEAALFKVYCSAIRLVAAQDYSPAQIAAWAPADMDMALWAHKMQALLPWVAERAGEVVGYADVQPNGYIDHFFVCGHHGRQGIGTQLMAHLHAQAQAQGIGTLTADVSQTAEAFFLRHGFQVIERQHPVLRGVTLHNAHMRKTLPKG